MTTTINNRVIQPKPARYDNNTDNILSTVFKNLLMTIKEHHDMVVELAEMINIPVHDEEKFYSWQLNH